ncbi:MAG: ABC transporter ATP-binding protein [Coriobacteriales bacterium]|jgi:putative spermidine/putrescine transport system ATP-binding protein|nr:ABC transporter ATP-binding protein [Coriobacteriales bacterium]
MSLVVENISLALNKKPILNEVSFTLDDGEFQSLLGVSGAGKSTTLKIIAGLLNQDSGHLIFDGETLDEIPSYGRKTAVVFQDVRLFPNMSVEDNVAFPLRMQGMRRRERLERANEMLEMVQLPDFGRRRVHEISGGQQQRVALARAIAGSPRLLLLDEPFSGLDESLRDDMRLLVLGIHKQLKMTTLMVTHDAYEALMMSDHIVYMADGRVIQDSTPDALYNEPRSLEAAACFGDCSILDGSVQDGWFTAGDFRLPSREGRADGRAGAAGTGAADSSAGGDKPVRSDGPARAVIRNNALRVAPDGPLSLRVTQCVYRGESFLVTLDAAGQDLTFSTATPLTPGETVRIELDLSRIFLFS